MLIFAQCKIFMHKYCFVDSYKHINLQQNVKILWLILFLSVYLCFVTIYIILLWNPWNPSCVLPNLLTCLYLVWFFVFCDNLYCLPSKLIESVMHFQLCKNLYLFVFFLFCDNVHYLACKLIKFLMYFALRVYIFIYFVYFHSLRHFALFCFQVNTICHVFCIICLHFYFMVIFWILWRLILFDFQIDRVCHVICIMCVCFYFYVFFIFCGNLYRFASKLLEFVMHSVWCDNIKSYRMNYCFNFMIVVSYKRRQSQKSLLLKNTSCSSRS